MYIYT